MPAHDILTNSDRIRCEQMMHNGCQSFIFGARVYVREGISLPPLKGPFFLVGSWCGISVYERNIYAFDRTERLITCGIAGCVVMMALIIIFTAMG